MIARLSDLESVARFCSGPGALFDFETSRGTPLEMQTIEDARRLDVPEGTVTIRISATLFAGLVDTLLEARGVAR